MKKLFVIATLIAFCTAGVATAQSADKVSPQAPVKAAQEEDKKDSKSCCKKSEAKSCSSKDEKGGVAKSCCKGGTHDHAKTEEKK